jgi:hypothetical protein
MVRLVEQDELATATPGEMAMPPSMQWSRKLSHEMIEHLTAAVGRQDVDLNATLKAMAETLLENVMGRILDQAVQEAATAYPVESTAGPVGDQVAQLAKAVLTCLQSDDSVKRKALWQLSKKVAEDAWALTEEATIATLLSTDYGSNSERSFFDLDYALKALLTKRATAFVNNNEASKRQLGDSSKPQGRGNDDPPEPGAFSKKSKSSINGNGDTGFKSFSLFDLLDKNPSMAASIDQEPVTACNVMGAYHELPSAESSGDPGLDRLTRAISMLERVECMQDLTAPVPLASDENSESNNASWADIVRVLSEGLDLTQVVARQDDDDAIVQSSGNYSSGAGSGGFASSFAAADTQGDDFGNESGDKNPWGATLLEGDDANLLEQQIQVALRFIQMHQDLFGKCSREAAAASGLAVSSSNNFVAQKYDLVHSLLLGIIGFFRENSYLLLVLSATKRPEKIRGGDAMSTDENVENSPDSKNTEERSTFTFSCRPGLDLAARMVSLCHELLAALTEDLAYLSGPQVDALFIRYFSLMKTLDTPPVSLPSSATSGSATENGGATEEHVIVSGVFHLQPAHFFTALDPTASLFSTWIRQISPQQVLEYFKFTNLLHDIFTKSNPHDGDDILGKQRLTSSSSSSSSVSPYTAATSPENDGKSKAKTGLTGSGFGAQHNIINVALGGSDQGNEETGSDIRVQDLTHAHFAWSLTALKSCLYTLGPLFPQEGTVHPLSRQLFRMDRLAISEAKPEGHGGLSVRQFECAPLVEMGGEDNIALLVTFFRVLQHAIKSKDPLLVDLSLVKVCIDGIWSVGYSTLMVHPSVFGAGMVQFFLTSTSCGMCNSIGVNPLLGTTQAVLAMFRLCDSVLASDPYHTTVPAKASSVDINTYEKHVFENMQRVLTFVMNDKTTLDKLRNASLSTRRRSMAALTEIIIPMRRLRSRLDIGQDLSSATQQWILMIQVYMQVSSALGMQEESLMVLSQLLGMQPQGWWLIEQALKERTKEATFGSAKQVIQNMYHEWSLAVSFGDAGVIDSASTLPLISFLASNTTDVVSNMEVLARCVVDDLRVLQDKDWQQRQGLEHLSQMIMCSSDSHFALQDESGREAMFLLQQTKTAVVNSATFNLDTVCLLKHHQLLSAEEERANAAFITKLEFEQKECMVLNDTKQKMRSKFWNNLYSGVSKMSLLPMFVSPEKSAASTGQRKSELREADLDKKPPAGKHPPGGQNNNFDHYWKTIHFYSEADPVLGALVLSGDHSAAKQLIYSITTGDSDSANEALCVDWFAVCMNSLAGGNCMALAEFLESLKTMPGIMYLWPRLHPNMASRKRYLLTLAASVHDVLGKECPEVARALEEVCQCPTWSFIPTWMQQNMMGIVSFADALYILHTSMVHGVDYLVYYAVAVLRHSQGTIVEAAAASQLLHPSMMRETHSFCAKTSDDFVHGLCKKYRGLVLELLGAGTI